MIFNIFTYFGLFSIIFGLHSTDYALLNSKNEQPKVYYDEEDSSTSSVQSYDFLNRNNKNFTSDIELKLSEGSQIENYNDDSDYDKMNSRQLQQQKATRKFKKTKRKKNKKHKNNKNQNLQIDFATSSGIDAQFGDEQQQQQQQTSREISNKNRWQQQRKRKRNQFNSVENLEITSNNNNNLSENTNSIIQKHPRNNHHHNFNLQHQSHHHHQHHEHQHHQHQQHNEFQTDIDENQRSSTTSNENIRRKYVEEDNKENDSYASEHKHQKKLISKRKKDRKLKKKLLKGKSAKSIEATARKKHEKNKYQQNKNTFSDADLVQKIIEEKPMETLDYFERKPDEKSTDFNGMTILESAESFKPSATLFAAQQPIENIGSDKSVENSMVQKQQQENGDVIERFLVTDVIRNGDLSCFSDDFKPAPEIPHADVKYLRNEGNGDETSYLEVEYICHQGYKLVHNDDNINKMNVFCRNGHWIGELPFCKKENQNDVSIIQNTTTIKASATAADGMMMMMETCNYPERCDQLCLVVENGIEKCSCHKGFKMKNNHCQDINECAENLSDCEFECENRFGSYKCKCPQGLRLGDSNKCIDVNECLLRNGHGPCQDICINTWGSYKCSCDSLIGSQLSPDGHSCSDIDECTISNGNCSHTCINTMGRAYCVCPEGWTIDKDWKTCVDIDECAEEVTESSEQKCEFGCINTPGSFSCLVDFGADQPIYDELTECSDGFYYNLTTQDCQDKNECLDNNGGCFHLCINTIGSYYCSCQPGYVFTIDKRTCINSNSSGNISCPPLFPPKHGYLECSRPIASDDDTIGAAAGTATADDDDNNKNDNEIGDVVARHQITNRLGSQCILRCPTGFRINGKFSKQCSNNGTWIGDDDGTCIRYPTPKLICPANLIVETPPNETMAKIRIPRPKTDVNFDRDVTMKPEWLQNSEIALEIGTRNITYTAQHPISKILISCTFAVTVLEGEPPKVIFCPSTQTYSLDSHHESIEVKWKEPVFTDNINVTEISKTNMPGNRFGVGSHQIIYVAKDNAGYISKCIFKVLVNVPIKETINHPLPIYRMFYK